MARSRVAEGRSPLQVADQLELLDRGQRRQEVGRLVDEGDVVSTQRCASTVVQPARCGSGHRDLTGVGSAQQTDNGQEGGFTGTRFARDHHHLAGAEGEAQLVEDNPSIWSIDVGDNDVRCGECFGAHDSTPRAMAGST
jgi:hypothetical protein